MSIKVMSLVWDSAVPAPERFTLLALADRADDEGRCWPSVDSVAKKCATTSRTIRRHLITLQELGVLTVEHRVNASSHYSVNVAALTAACAPPAEPEAGPTPDNLSPLTDCHPCQDVTPDNLSPLTDSTLTPDNLSPNTSGIHQESKLASLAPREARSRTRRATQLPKSWSPGPEHRQRAESLGIDVDDETENFRLHAETHERTAKNWNAAFTMWLKKARRPAAPALPTGDVAQWLRAEWKAGRVRPIQDRTGLLCPAPELPLDVVTAEQRERYLVEHSRQWITANRERILERLGLKEVS